ncbi:cct6 [Ecytonucleospora hepatopenaei]|uniref:Cct6 n=1 Tax=Ecytonucleospora hepatopenaei TaxID=646526 RepID=A0A1W0E2N7_9MICR|nr:cct6 [Ecytonucleospora hepatopenaei]
MFFKNIYKPYFKIVFYMQNTKSEAKYTQEGQALAYSNLTCQQLIELFESCLGPNGSFKALVSGADQMDLTKNGFKLCRDIRYTHPTSIIITRAGKALFERVGDGIISFVLLTSHIFSESFSQYLDGSKISPIINSLQLAVDDVSKFLKENLLPFNDSNLRKLVLSQIGSKIQNGEVLVDIILQTLKHTNDLKLVELMKMDIGDLKDSEFVPGLVLDHGIRHAEMPTNLTNCVILTTNMSLEYEKPEINAEFVYKNIEDRERLAKFENKLIIEKTEKIVELANEMRKQGKHLVVISEKGIDLQSLEILAKGKVLALRRCKKRNLERLVNICGGRVVTQVHQLKKENLGFCNSVNVKKVGEDQFTFVEGVPLKGASTILIKGNVDFSRIQQTIQGTLRSVMLAINEKCVIRGGKQLYCDLIKLMKQKAKEVNHVDSLGYGIIAKVFEKMCKTLIKNEGKPAQETFAYLMQKGDSEIVIDNASVLGNVLTNSIFTSASLLMCDEMILAGKKMSEEN